MDSAANRITRLYNKYRTRDMTILSLFADNAINYVILCGVFISAYILYVFLAPSIANYLIVAFAAIIIRDYGYYRRTVRVWPFLKSVIDWSKIEPTSNEWH